MFPLENRLRHVQCIQQCCPGMQLTLNGFFTTFSILVKSADKPLKLCFNSYELRAKLASLIRWKALSVAMRFSS